MCKDDKCELYDEGVVDVVHFLLHCGEFAGDRGRLLGMIECIEGTEEWMAEWKNKGDEGRVGLLLGRSVAGMKERVLVKIDRVVMGNMLKWWERRKYLMFGTKTHIFGTPTPPPSSLLPPKVPCSFLVRTIHNNAISYLFIYNIFKS